MTFSTPWFLPVGLALALLAALGIWRHARRRRRLADFVGGRRAAGRLALSDLYRMPVERMLLLGVAALALAGAAAEPRWREAPPPPPEPPPSSVVLAVDVSASMQASDVQPTRLARAAAVARELLGDLEGQRVGLVLFAGSAYTLAPPTLDHDVLDYLLEGVTPDLVNVYDPGSLPSEGLRESVALLVPPSGDSPGEAGRTGESPEGGVNEVGGIEEGGAAGDGGVAEAAGVAEERGLAGGVSSANGGSGRRSVVLIGDGEAGEPLESIAVVAREAADAGIRIHAVGVGTPEGGEMILPPGYRRKGTDGIGPRGPMLTRLEEEPLRDMAGAGSGLYVHADDTAGLERLRRIFRAPAGPFIPALDAAPWTRLDPAAWLTVLALAALLVESLLGVRLPRVTLSDPARLPWRRAP